MENEVNDVLQMRAIKSTGYGPTTYRSLLVGAATVSAISVGRISVSVGRVPISISIAVSVGGVSISIAVAIGISISVTESVSIPDHDASFYKLKMVSILINFTRNDSQGGGKLAKISRNKFSTITKKSLYILYFKETFSR